MPAPRGKPVQLPKARRPWNIEPKRSSSYKFEETERQRFEREACLNCTVPGGCAPHSHGCGLRGLQGQFHRKKPQACPDDFDEISKRMTYKEMQSHYKVSRYVIKLWRKERNNASR